MHEHEPGSRPATLNHSLDPAHGHRMLKQACGIFPGPHAALTTFFTGPPCLSARVCMAPGYMAHAGLIASTIRAMHITVVAELAMFTVLCRLVCEC